MSLARYIEGQVYWWNSSRLTCKPISAFRYGFGENFHIDKIFRPILTQQKTEGQTGHVGVLAHKQPTLEKHLRSTVGSFTLCELRSNCLLTSISEDDDWVYATYKDASGEERKLRAKFLAAADGKTGFTRKMYLEPKGIRLDWAEQYAIPNVNSLRRLN